MSAQNSGSGSGLRYGFIYPLFSTVVQALVCLNMVELFKKIAMWLEKDSAKVGQSIRVSIDIFIVLKWTVVGLLWYFGASEFFATVVILYLVFTNVFTYFYHHVWCVPREDGEDWKKSRFVALMLSCLFNLFCFAYLYDVVFAPSFSVSGPIRHSFASVFLSASFSVLADFSGMVPISTVGHALAFTQKAITFVFLSILLSISVPQLAPPQSQTP